MKNVNPYSPPSIEATTSSIRPTICIDKFRILDGGFMCSVLSRRAIVELFREELIRYCTELGFQVVENGEEYRVAGQFTTVNQGSRLLRLLVPWILGAVNVAAAGQIMRGSEVVQRFELRQRKAIGFQGGNSRSLIELCIRQISMRVGSDAGVVAGQISVDKSDGVARYLSITTVIAVLVSTGLAWLAYRWALTLPVRKDGLEDGSKFWWACIVAILVSMLVFLTGLAVAPTKVLASRTLLSLRAASGVKTITAQRAVFALLSAAPIGLLYLCYLCL